MTITSARLWFVALWALVALPVLAADAPAVVELRAQSEPSRLQVTMTSRLVPVTVNQMHSWVIRLRDNAGNPVTGATITVDGGMPLHNHGLPTRPEVTRSLGDGEYLLEGMRFHMHGLWEIRLDIQAGQARDSVSFELDV
ncbi:MAG: hypothetical protein RLZZ385_1499 [Pseudomonadota bacterium]|jgi:hypothetical protein